MPTDAPIATTPAGETKQPRGIYLLFAVEMWERFSYYGMRALLVLFLVDAQHGGMGWDRASAQRLYGWYGFFAYVLPVLGGAAADRWLGTHRAILIGGLIIAAGHFCLATPIAGTFFAGLVLVVVGTGFFKANVSTMVGQLYRERDPRRDAGFTIYYMGVNIGRAAGAARVRLPGGEPALGVALRLRRRRRGDGPGSRVLRGAQESLPARHRAGAHPDRVQGG